jgi:hypothetical protein
MSKLSTCINIMHSFSSFYCVPHIFLSFYLQNVFSTKKLAFIWGGWDALRSYHFFSITIICRGSRVLGFTSFTDNFPRLPSKSWSFHQWWSIRRCLRFVFELKGGSLGLWTCWVVLRFGGTLMMFLCFALNFLLCQFSLKAPFKSSSWNTCIICVKACTYHNVGKNFFKQD